MGLYLTTDELVETTDYKRRDKQIEALACMDIPFRITPRGTIKVLRTDIIAGKTRERAMGRPDLEAI